MHYVKDAGSYLARYEMVTRPYPDDAECCIGKANVKLVKFDGERERKVASCELYIVDLTSAEHFTDAHDLLDIDGVTYEFTPLFNMDFTLKKEVLDRTALTGKFNDNVFERTARRLFIIHNLKVKAKHRGNKLSSLLIRDIEWNFLSRLDLLALKAFPLENNTPETTESLADYYESLDFVRAGVNDILLLGH